VRCNSITAAILMPHAPVPAQPEVQARINARASWTYSSLAAAAAPFGVSTEAFLRRLVDLGRVDPSFYSARREEYLARYEDEEAKSQGGGDWYRNTARDLGKGINGSAVRRSRSLPGWVMRGWEVTAIRSLAGKMRAGQMWSPARGGAGLRSAVPVGLAVRSRPGFSGIVPAATRQRHPRVPVAVSPAR
jgi:hypothetical protein